MQDRGCIVQMGESLRLMKVEITSLTQPMIVRASDRSTILSERDRSLHNMVLYSADSTWPLSFELLSSLAISTSL